MHRLRRPHGAVLILVAILIAVPVAGGASPKAKVKLTPPSAVSAGAPASIAVAVTSKDKKALKGLKLELVLSTDSKRDGQDVVLAKGVSLGTIKPKKTVKRTAQVTLPATIPAGAFRLVGCLKAPKAKKKDKLVCASAPLAVQAAGVGPGPLPTATAAPLPTAVPTATPTVAPTATATPAPTATATPTPEPTATPTPDPTPDPTPPAPGPKLDPPVEPATIAPEVKAEEATSVKDATSFLYEGGNAIQQGVEAGTIKEKRVAVLRGRVTNRQGTQIAGVKVSVADHGEYGHTATQADGGYDIAVNGGGPLTIVFEREGYIPVQRMVEVPWQDYADVDPVVMVPFDGKETDVDTSGSAPFAVAEGTTVGEGTDAERTATLLFPKGTEATMEVDGEDKPVTDLDVRVTEYTQGASGIDAMPGQLPPNTAYTYAAEFSVDQAVQNEATDVEFSKPLISYTDNFIDLPTGTLVPTGYYDREREEWVGSENGLVIEIVGKSDDGKAALVSIDGDPEAESDGELAAIGMTVAERERLAGLYEVGKQLWRVRIKHFTPWDYNMPYGPDGDAGGPGTGGPSGGNGGDEDGDPGDCGQSGSLILCDSQVLGEAIPLTGSEIELVYRSDRVPGRTAERTIDIPIVEGDLPANPNFVGAELEIDIAGQQIRKSFAKEALTAGFKHRFEWDGRDAYGRPVQGGQPAKVRVGYTYKAVYQQPGGQFTQAWSRLSGQPISGNRARQEYTVWQEDETKLGSFDTSATGLGGWTLSIHHAYDPGSRTLLMGDGSQRDSDPARLSILDDYAGAGWAGYGGDGGEARNAYLDQPHGVAVAPDGSVVVADTENNRVRRIGADGKISTIAGTGTYGAAGDGGPAAEAQLAAPRGVAVAENGDVYIADTGNDRVRRIRVAADPDTISTLAGGGAPADGLGDGLDAKQAQLRGPTAVAIAPDGAIYVADTFAHRIRMIGTDDIIGTVAGTGSGAFSGDGGQAAAARLRLPQGVAVDPEGALYVADTANNRIRRIGIDGVIASVAGGGFPADGRGDGGLATAARLIAPVGVAVSPENDVLVVDSGSARVRRVDAEGTIRTIAGGAAQEPDKNGLPATATRLIDPTAVGVAPDGKLYIAERYAHRIRVSKLLGKGFAEGDSLIASEDGAEIYQFTEGGQHDRTLDGLTGATKHDFHYDGSGRLLRVSDADGDLLTVDRASGLALVARGGARTALTLQGDYLKTVTNPAGEAVTLGYRVVDQVNTGLLTSLEDPSGGDHVFAYDDQGRLISDTGPAGLVKTLQREELADGTQITLTVADETAQDKKWVYANRRLTTGDSERTVTDPAGATTTTLRRTDGSVQITEPDGTVSKFVNEPDPRFGMQTPIAAREERRTPGGKTRVITRTRTATTGTTVAELQSMSETVTVDGRQASRYYDGTTRTMTASSPGGRTTTTRFDARGRIVETAPNAAAATHEVVTEYFDAGHGLGKVKSVTQGGRSWTYAYDQRQRMVTRTDARGDAVQFAYDAADRLTEVDNGAPGKWVYEYDLNGNTKKITMPQGQVYAPGYADDDLVESLALPGGDAYGRAYTQDRLLKTRTFPSSAVETSGYSAGGRLTSIATGATSHGFTYEPDKDGAGETELGDVSTWNGAGAEQTIATDYDGSLPTSVAFGGAASGTFGYVPTNDHMVSSYSVTVPGNAVRTYGLSRDSDRLVTKEGDWNVPRVQQTGTPDNYNVSGVPALTLDEGHDGYGSLISRAIGDDYALTITRDATGRVSGKTETVAGATTEFRYAHDSSGRLTKVERRDAGAAEFTVVDEHAYADNGNRTDDAAQYDEQDRIEHLGAIDYDHDADGFMTGRGDDAYVYGRRGELLQANIAGDDVTYAYDAHGRRTKRTRGADSTQYLYGNTDDVFRVTATVDETGALTTYLYDDEGHLRALERGGQRFVVGADQVGSPRVVVDSTGAIVKHVEYDAWGVADDKHPAFDLPIGYAGGIADADTGLVRFGLRDYDPVSGRWTARDPAFFGGSPLNLYAYVANDPVSLRDPSGLVCIGMSAYIIIGGGFQLCADSSGVGACAEGGVGLGLGAELDATGQPGNSDTTVAELTASVGVASATFGAEYDDCGNVTIKTTAGVAGVEIGASGGTNQPAKFEAKGGIGLPLPISGKFAKKSCRSFSF